MPSSVLSSGPNVSIESGDAPGTRLTDENLLLGATFVGSITSGDSDWIKIELLAGEDYNILGFGTGGYQGLKDISLRLYDRNGTLVAENNDTSHDNPHSTIEYVASSSGEYFIEVIGADQFEQGQYEVLFGAEEFTVQQTAAYIADFAWGVSAQLRLIDDDGVITFNVSSLTADGKLLARTALDVWSEVSGIRFQETTSNSAGIRFDDSEPGAFAGPGAFYGDGSNIFSRVNVGTDYLSRNGTELDSFSFFTYIHEIGHALGLGHAGPYNGFATYDDATYSNDSWQMTAMSYFSLSENTSITGAYAPPVTPMMADIVAIQSIYGFETSSQIGDTIYGARNTAEGYLGDLMDVYFDGKSSSLFSGDRTVAITLYDDGGIDEISLAGRAENSRVDLRAGTSSDILGAVGILSIATNTIIENFTGGTGSDVVTGNYADNSIAGELGNDELDGMAGNDRLSGGGGADSLDGGAGADTLIGGADNDVYLVDDWQDTVIELDNEGYDTVRSSVSYRSVMGVEVVELLGELNANLYGDKHANTLVGNDGSNVLLGGDGADLITGGSGNDLLDGQLGNDTLRGGEGDDTYVVSSWRDEISEAGGNGYDRIVAYDTYRFFTGVEKLELRGNSNINAYGNDENNIIVGNAGDNYLEGSGGDDVLNGGAGIDRMYGGTGNDTYFVGAWKDEVSERGGNGTDTINAYVSYRTISGVEILNLAGDKEINAYGSNEDNIIIGNESSNRIEGGGGTDILTGDAGADNFVYIGGHTTITDYSEVDLDVVSVDPGLLRDEAMMSFGALVEGDAVYDFGGGNRLVLQNQATLDLDILLLA